jgi:hypothetical protein
MTFRLILLALGFICAIAFVTDVWTIHYFFMVLTAFIGSVVGTKLEKMDSENKIRMAQLSGQRRVAKVTHIMYCDETLSRGKLICETRIDGEFHVAVSETIFDPDDFMGKNIVMYVDRFNGNRTMIPSIPIIAKEFTYNEEDTNYSTRGTRGTAAGGLQKTRGTNSNRGTRGRATYRD